MHCRRSPSMEPKSLFWCKPSQMEQERQMVQETSLCAKKQQLSKVQRPKALPELTWIVRAVSARSRRELESGKLLGSYVQAQL